MRHTPEGPAPRARPLGHRSGRLAVSTLLSTVVTALVLAAPVVAGQGAPHSPVVLGQDGVPSSETFAGLTSAATFSSSTGETSAVPGTTRSAPAPESAAPTAAAPAPPEQVEAAPVVPEPAPEAAPAPTPVEEPEPDASAPRPPTDPAADPAAPASGGTEDQLVALVNRERAAAGCRPVSADGGLASVARAHSADMRDRDYFDHVSLDGLSPFDRADRAGVTARAENIARGQVDATDVMSSWMTSAGHRANILDCSLTRLGVGIAEGSGGPWWTQLFA